MPVPNASAGRGGARFAARSQGGGPRSATGAGAHAAVSAPSGGAMRTARPVPGTPYRHDSRGPRWPAALSPGGKPCTAANRDRGSPGCRNRRFTCYGGRVSWHVRRSLMRQNETIMRRVVGSQPHPAPFRAPPRLSCRRRAPVTQRLAGSKSRRRCRGCLSPDATQSHSEQNETPTRRCVVEPRDRQPDAKRSKRAAAPVRRALRAAAAAAGSPATPWCRSRAARRRRPSPPRPPLPCACRPGTGRRNRR